MLVELVYLNLFRVNSLLWLWISAGSLGSMTLQVCSDVTSPHTHMSLFFSNFILQHSGQFLCFFRVSLNMTLIKVSICDCSFNTIFCINLGKKVKANFGLLFCSLVQIVLISLMELMLKCF